MAQVQGEEIYLSHSGQEVDDNIDEVVAARGSEASLSARLADIVSDFETDQQRQETEIGVVAALGAKNLLKMDNAAGYTLTTHGRTFEVLADGGIKITGDTPDTSYADFYVSGTWGTREPILNAAEKDLILSFACADPLQTQNLYIRAVDRRTGSTVSTATARLNQEAPFAFPITTVLITVQPSVVLPSGGITVYPMIRRAEITDSTYVPYAPTNRELYEAKADKGTFDLTIAGSPLVASEYSYSCVVTGDIVTVCIRIVLGAELAVNTSRNLFKIPSGYYASVAVAGTGYADGKVRVFWINTSGDVKIRIDEAIPAGASINANFCYSYKAANWSTVTPASLQSVSPPLMQAGRIDAELTGAENDEAETGEGDEER